MANKNFIDAILMLTSRIFSKTFKLLYILFWLQTGLDDGALAWDAQRVTAFAPQAEGLGFRNLDHDRPKSLKQVLTVPLLNARQKVWMSGVLEYDHDRFSV